MAPQNRSDARHICYGRPTNQSINQLAKDTKIQKTKHNEKQCRCCFNQTQNDTCKDGVQDKIAQTKETMNEPSQQRLAPSLANYVSNALIVCLGPQGKKLVLQKFFST
jgi:hypothetical protein